MENPECIAVDYVPSRNACYNISQTLSLDPRLPETGVRHYRKARRQCQAGNSCKSTFIYFVLMDIHMGVAILTYQSVYLHIIF